MHKRLDRAHLAIPLVLGLVTLISVGMLLAWDVNPKFFPSRAHDFLAVCPLAMIAIAYLLYQSARQPAAKEFVKAIMLAIAFLFWAANQLWPDLPQATLCNDFAIGLFVLDVFLVIIGWPTTSPDESDKSTSYCPAELGSPGERFEPAPEEPSIHQGHLPLARRGFRSENGRRRGAASAEGRSKLQSRGRKR